MRTLLKAAVIIALTCVLAIPCVHANDTTNSNGSIKTGGFIGQNPLWDFSLFTALTSGSLNDTNNTETGPSIITGNVGIGGQGSFSMSDGQLNGDLYMNSSGSFTMSGPAQFNGTEYKSQDTVLNYALKAANYLSSQAATDTSTVSYMVTQGSFNGTTENGNQNVTLNGTGKIVLKLQDFVMTGGTFTLQGTAMTTYIIDVSRNFSLNNSKIVLSGMLTASHVLFNITGTGQDVSLQQGTSMYGILLATQRKVDLSGGKVFGRVIAEQLTVTSGGQIISQ